MIPKLSRLSVLILGLAGATCAVAGPDAAPLQGPVHQSTVVKWHKKIVDTVLVACGVIEPAPVYVAPGYLEITGPAPMLVYRPAGAMPLRRVPPAEREEKPAPAVANPLPSLPTQPAPATVAPPPAPTAAPESLPAGPAPEPAPADAEPGILPGTETPGSSARVHTDELLSYFQRQHAVSRPYSASPLPPGEAAPNDPAAEPPFLLAPQGPEQPVLPPSRATYHVAP